jgi:formylglycine-generating enzyme required for sulfatase activity
MPRPELGAQGRIIAGRFELKRFIGSGPLGDVYYSQDLEDGSAAAVKLLLRELFSSDADRSAFIGEMVSQGRHSHPYLVVAHHADTTPDGIVFLVSRFVQGMSLARSISSRPVVGQGFSLKEIEPLFVQLKDGLEAAHPRLPHGGLAPSNVIIQPDYLKITDIGLALHLPEGVFAAYAVKGAGAAYIAPEVLEGERPDQRSDVYSAGKLLAASILGEVPAETGAARFYDGDEALDALLREICSRAAEREPSARYGSVGEFWRRLEGVFSRYAGLPPEKLTVSSIHAAGGAGPGEPLEGVPPAPPSPPPGRAAAVEKDPVHGRIGGFFRRRGGWAVVAAVALLALAAAWAWMHFKGQRIPKTPLQAINVPSSPGPGAAPEAPQPVPPAQKPAATVPPPAKPPPPSAPEQAKTVQPSLSPAPAAEKPARESSCPPGTALIGAGTFMMGSKPGDPMRNWEERAWEQVKTAAYCIDLYEYPNEKGRTPITSVTMADAKALCSSTGKRLCTEEEWERACKGPGNRRYPYGEDWDPNQCSTETAAGDGRPMAAAGRFPKCASGHGVFDMSGNAAEWVQTRGQAVVKGGSSSKSDWAVRCAARAKTTPGARSNQIGFRCCKNPI